MHTSVSILYELHCCCITLTKFGDMPNVNIVKVDALIIMNLENAS